MAIDRNISDFIDTDSFKEDEYIPPSVLSHFLEEADKPIRIPTLPTFPEARGFMVRTTPFGRSRWLETGVPIEFTRVEPRHFPLLANWRREHTMEKILTELKREMASALNRKLPQPPEGSIFT